jgi:hypothetical protein
MNWLGWAILLLALWLAFKVAGVLFRVLLWLLVAVLLYWLLAPLLGLPRPF